MNGPTPRALARVASIAAVLLPTLLPPAVRAAAWEGIDRIPGASPVTVLVEDKPRTYFRITPGAPLAIQIDGPARLRVVSRAELPAGSNAVARYRLIASAAGKNLDEQSTESSASSLVRLSEGTSALGKSRRMVVDIPAGSHRVTLTLEGADAVVVRLLQAAPKRGEEPMVALTPVDAARSVTVTEGEKTITYYSAMPGKPVKLRVVGPTVLDLSTRLDFDATMRGTQSYRLRVAEREKPLRDLEFKTTKATTASYDNLRDRVPSKLDRTRIPIDQGLHEITVSLVQPASGAVEVHARIPQPAVGNEE